MPDVDPEPYVYTEYGRRPVTWLALSLSIGIMALAVVTAAPWYVLPPIALALIGSLYMVLHNPASGMRLTGDTWAFHGAGFDRKVPIGTIDHVTFTSWSDGPDTVRIHTHTGQVLEPPSMCLLSSEVLKEKLALADIPIAGN